jgi:hypothetical protein
MAIYTEKSGFDYPAHSHARVKYMQVTVDYDKVVAARAAAGDTALVAGDSLAVIDLGANSLLLGGGAEVTVASSSVSSPVLDFGYTGATASLVSDLAADATGAESNGLAAPVYFSSAETLDLLLKTALPTGAVVRVWALVADCD